MSAIPTPSNDGKRSGAPHHESATKDRTNYELRVPYNRDPRQELTNDEKQAVADGLFIIEWKSNDEGFMECPGAGKHTGKNDRRDCKIYIDGGKAPTIKCFHTSCESEIAEANYRLRSALGKAKARAGAFSPHLQKPAQKPAIAPPPSKIRLDPLELPKALLDPIKTHLEACFEPREEVGWVATTNNGKTPTGGGTTYGRDWLVGERENILNPNGHGLYIRVNPMQHDGTKAEHVAAYRHTLIESDDAPLELQWAAAIASGLPISSVVFSGGKSLHLLVKVDAGDDLAEFNRRGALAKQALERYEGYKADATQDPARLTRLGGGRRGEKTQDLLAVNIGAASWEEWEAKRDVEAQALAVSSEQSADASERPRAQSSIYYLKQGGKFLWRQPSGQAVFADTKAVERVYQNEINPFAAKPELSQFVYEVQTAQALNYAGSMPGYCEGLHEENGQRFYCMAWPVMPKAIPPKGAQFGERWPVICQLMRRLFVDQTGKETQFLTVFAHLKMAQEVLKQSLEPGSGGSGRSVRPGQAMAFIGPKNSGKSLFLDCVIKPLLGGRLVDAYKAFMADAEGFNGELLNGEVWMIDDQESATDIRTRRKFAANLKSKLFGASMAFHAKYSTPVTLKPFGRLFVCGNSTPENLSVLPPITDDISDKIHLILCNKAEMPMPTGTESERAAFRAAIAQEIPHLAGELEAWSIPAEVAHQRTGVLTYLNPWVEEQLRMQSPEAQLVELILSAFETGTFHGRVWEGPARQLKERLTDENYSNHRDARSLLSTWPQATGTYLARLVANSATWEGTSGLKIEASGQLKGIQRYRLSSV